MEQVKKVYYNGAILHERDANIGLQDLALNRGYGVFDYFHVYEHMPLHMEAHLNRLLHSCEIMHLPLPLSKTDLASAVIQLIEANGLQNTGVKILVTGGESSNGYSIEKPSLIITTPAIPAKQMKTYESGISLITHQYQRDLPEAKSINYSKGIWLLPAIAAAGANDVLYYFNNHVLECPRSNVFVVSQHQEVLTPANGVLMGITRQQVLSISRQLFTTYETDISMSQLQHASEVFITSTTKGIMPVTCMDGKKIGNGEIGKITRQLMQELASFEKTHFKIPITA
jgi:D-alanine transaminase/branched-chain amino acid aminotransferase